MRDVEQYLEWLAKCEPGKFKWLPEEEGYLYTYILLPNGKTFHAKIPSTDACHEIAAAMGYVLCSPVWSWDKKPDIDTIILGSGFYAPGDNEYHQSGNPIDVANRKEYAPVIQGMIQQTLCAAIAHKHGEPQ